MCKSFRTHFHSYCAFCTYLYSKYFGVEKLYNVAVLLCKGIVNDTNYIMKDQNNSNSVLVVTSTSRSVSPLTPSPSREIRGLKLFRAISRKLKHNSVDDLSYTTGEDDSRSSSTDSSSSTNTRRKFGTEKFCAVFRSSSPNTSSDLSSSSSSSENGSDENNINGSTSLRKAFEGLSIRNDASHQRSQSCETLDRKVQSSKKNVQPKRILRSPITYTYVRGISGLPTQRVPRSTQRSYTKVQSQCCYGQCEHFSRY